MKLSTKIILIILLMSSMCHAQYYSADEYYAEGKKLLDIKKYEQAIPLLEKAVELNPTAANYRALAEAYEGAEIFPKAVEAYRKEAAIYRKKGDINAAIVEEQKANSLDVQFEIYFAVPAEKNNTKLAKGEPQRGCYTGAYIEDDRRILGNFEKFNKYTGKNHSSFYAYIHYGEPFPKAWCEKIKSLGAIPHIAWEPNDGLDKVKDDQYSQAFADEAAGLKWPVFLRFASEMNGDWTAYYGNPKLYKEKFKLVHNIFEKRAPKVIMLWSPNSIPQSNITDYYPGDEYVDWVGVNIYSVHHHAGDIERDAEKEDPTYLLEYIYKLYGEKKPIQVSEFASTHFCKACGQDVTEFGLLKMGQMYGTIPLMFPRVKCINWFDCNTIEETEYEVTSPNNYSLTDNLKILNYYRKLISCDYFIEKINTDGKAEIPDYEFSLFKDNSSIEGKGLICSSVRSYLKKPCVNYYIDGKKINSLTEAPYYLNISEKPGNHTLKARLEGDGRGVISSKEIKFTIKEGDMAISYNQPEAVTEKVPEEKEPSGLLWREKWGGWVEEPPTPAPTQIKVIPSPVAEEKETPAPGKTLIPTPGDDIVPGPGSKEKNTDTAFFAGLWPAVTGILSAGWATGIIIKVTIGITVIIIVIRIGKIIYNNYFD